MAWIKSARVNGPVNVSGCQGEIITCSALSSICQRHRSFVPLKTQMKKGNIKVLFHTHTSHLSESHSCCYLPHSLTRTCSVHVMHMSKSQNNQVSLCVLLSKNDSLCSLSSNRLVLGKQERQLITMSSLVAPTKQRKTRNGRKKDSLASLFWLTSEYHIKGRTLQEAATLTKEEDSCRRFVFNGGSKLFP